MPEGGLDHADRLLLWERRNPVLQLLEIEGGIHADDVGPRRQELAELDVGGAEPRQSALQRTRPCAEARPFQHPPELQGEAQMRRQLGGVDERQPAFARQNEADPGTTDEIDDGA